MKVYLKTKGKFPSIDHLSYGTIGRYLKSEQYKDLEIETNNPMVIDQVELDNAEDWNIKFGDLDLSEGDCETLYDSYDRGFETVSEMLLSRGLWGDSPLCFPGVEIKIKK